MELLQDFYVTVARPNLLNTLSVSIQTVFVYVYISHSVDTCLWQRACFHINWPLCLTGKRTQMLLAISSSFRKNNINFQKLSRRSEIFLLLRTVNDCIRALGLLPQLMVMFQTLCLERTMDFGGWKAQRAQRAHYQAGYLVPASDSFQSNQHAAPSAPSQPWATPVCEIYDPGQPACTKQRLNSIGHVGISGVQGRILVFRIGCNSNVLKSIMLQKLFLAELALTQGRQTVTGKHLTHSAGQG